MSRQRPIRAHGGVYRGQRLLEAYAKDLELAALDELPFVGLVKRGFWTGAGQRCYWIVEPISPYPVDCALGAEYARLAFEHLRRFPSSDLIRVALTHMIIVSGGELDAIMIGFIGKVAPLVDANRGRSQREACPTRHVLEKPV